MKTCPTCNGSGKITKGNPGLRKCAWCGKAFEVGRSDQLHCKQGCRQAKYHARKREKA